MNGASDAVRRLARSLYPYAVCQLLMTGGRGGWKRLAGWPDVICAGGCVSFVGNLVVALNQRIKTDMLNTTAVNVLLY